MVIDKEKFFRTKKHLRSIERKLDSKFSKESGKIRKRGRRRHCLISRITLGSKIQKSGISGILFWILEHSVN